MVPVQDMIVDVQCTFGNVEAHAIDCAPIGRWITIHVHISLEAMIVFGGRDGMIQYVVSIILYTYMYMYMYNTSWMSLLPAERFT